MRPNQIANCSGIDRSRPEAGADLGDLLGVRRVAGEHRRRVPRRQPQHQEHQDGDDQQHRQRRQQPTGEEAAHRRSALRRPGAQEPFFFRFQ